MLSFGERANPEYPEYPEKNLSQTENQQTQPTYDVEKSGNRNRATLVEGERSRHYAIPVPLEKLRLLKEKLLQNKSLLSRTWY